MASGAVSVPDEVQQTGDPWMDAMRRGDFSRAWQISDEILKARLARGEPLHRGPRHLQSIWNGEPLAGKRVLVRCYHGLGDTIAFIRFVLPLRRLASHVTVWAQAPLVSLISTAAGVDRVLPLHDGAPGVPFDCDIEIMELAHALRVDLRSIACPVPYLFPNANHPPRLAKSANKLSVGLVWGAGDWDLRRSIPPRLLRPLSRVPGVQLFSLQRGPQAPEAESLPAQDIGSNNVGIAAKTFSQLDLIICVDTFAAHLAGALGLPVWLLLHADCDWRWMERRAESVWYPTMRLFRQQQAGDWVTVIEEVVAALQVLAMSRSNKVLEQRCSSHVRFS